MKITVELGFFHLPAVSYAEIPLMSYIACIYESKCEFAKLVRKTAVKEICALSFCVQIIHLSLLLAL